MINIPVLIDNSREIQHVSIQNAIKSGLISETSPVYKFFKEYMGSEYEDKFKLVIFAGSEMIGPSVQVAELTGCITKEMMKVSGKYDKKESSFCFLDIFSGSSATTIPSVKQFDTDKKKHIKIIRIDNSKPHQEDDYLKQLFEKSSNIYYETDDDQKDDFYKEIDVFNKIKEGNVNEIFKHAGKYDVCIADPPHYLTLNFLIGKKDSESSCVCKLLEEKVDVFIIYYAHKEQVYLCSQIRYELSKYFKYVYKVIVGSEEMAVCFNKGIHGPQIQKGLERFESLYRTRYDETKQLNIDYELSYPVKTPEKGIVIVFSGPSGIGKTNTIKKLTEKSPEGEFTNLKIELPVACTTRSKRNGEKDGEFYYFITQEEFQERIKQREFIEWSMKYDNLYGTLYYEIVNRVEKGINIILDIGYEAINKVIDNPDLINIRKYFILHKPCSKGDDIDRLKQQLQEIIRKREPGIKEGDLETRIAGAIAEIDNWLKCKEEYKNHGNVQFKEFEININNDSNREFVQKQTCYYLKDILKEAAGEAGKEIYSKTKAFKHFYYSIEKDEKDQILEKMITTFPDGVVFNNYLDIGAGTGNFTKSIIDQFKPEKSCLVEPSRKLLNLSRVISNQHIYGIHKEWEAVIDEELVSVGGNFNLITSFNVNYSDWEFSLNKINRYLSDDGYLVIAVLDEGCDYSKKTAEIKNIIGKNSLADTAVSTIEEILKQNFTVEKFDIYVDVKFKFTIRDNDNYRFKFMFGKWIDEINDKDLNNVRECLYNYASNGEYTLKAKHFLFFCKKKNAT